MPTITMHFRVVQTTTTTGTGSYTLSASAPAGRRKFSDVFSIGDLIPCCISDGTNFEAGYYTLTASDTLARTTIAESTNSNLAVNWGVGTRDVFCTLPASGFLFTANNLADLASSLVARVNLGTLPNGLSGGTDQRVVRVSGSNTCVDASNTDTVDQLVGLLLKVGGYYFPAGNLVTGLSGLTAGTVYYLGTAGALTSTAPTVSSTVRRVVVGKAVASSSLLFQPYPPITG